MLPYECLGKAFSLRFLFHLDHRMTGCSLVLLFWSRWFTYSECLMEMSLPALNISCCFMIRILQGPLYRLSLGQLYYQYFLFLNHGWLAPLKKIIQLHGCILGKLYQVQPGVCFVSVCVYMFVCIYVCMYDNVRMGSEIYTYKRIFRYN